jgi:ribulose 1,5-bisphosphate carboxylase large subunit-like protein
MVMSKFIPYGFLALLTGLFCSSCIREKLDLRLQAHRDATAGQIKELLSQSKSTDAEELDWATAVKLLKERNVSLQQARSRVAQLEKASDEQWKTWIPRLGFYFNVLSSIPQLGALSTGNVSASVAAPLNIPNPFTERAQAFANALSYLEAQDSTELTYRLQVSQRRESIQPRH